MTTAGPSNFSVGALAPMLALGALGFGIVALVAPLPFLKPPQQVADASSSLAPGPRPKPTVKPIEPQDWSKLEAPLLSLREPLTQAEIETGVHGTQPVAVEPEPDPGPAHHTLRWRYIGFISEPDRVAALVLMNDADQRLLYAGQTLRDSFDPEDKTITVVSVTESEIVVERAGRTERFQMHTPPDEPASATSPLRPTQTPPRNGTPPRRR